MEKLEVGGKFTLLANRPEGTFFEITESGPMWVFNYFNPSDEEIKDISEGSAFEIRESVLNGVMWLFLKCGGQKWAEAPYNPHLSKSPTLEPLTNESEGYGLTIMMVDAATQTIRHIRLIGLGNRFSRQLKTDVDELLSKPFDARVYDKAIQTAQLVYSTAQMAKNCRNYYRLR